MSLAEMSREQIEKTIYAALAQTEERAALLREMEQARLDQQDATNTAKYAAEREKTQGLQTRLRDLLGDPALQREGADSE
jgi:hypothetical protein